MAELSREAGVSRETIHFYLREGLLDAPHKTSRNMAWYDDRHLQRILLIKRLQHEKFLPLGVIKSLIRDGKALSTDGDVDFFADLITLDARRRDATDDGAPPTSASEAALDPARAAGAERYAEERGFLRPRTGTREPSEQRVVAAVAEAFALDLEARAFALADMDVCVGHLERLVRDETGVLVTRLLGSGDLRATLESFRASRPAVGRFIRAHRASLVHRIVEEALGELDRAANQHIDALAVPLSPGACEATGVAKERARLRSSRASLRDRARLEMGIGDLDRLAALVATSADADAELSLYRAFGMLRKGDATGAHALVRHVITGLDGGHAYVGALGGTLGLVAIVGHGSDFVGSRITLAAEPLRLLDRAIAEAPDASERDRAFTLYLTARSFLALPPIAGRRPTGIAHLEALLSLVDGKTTLETPGDALHLAQNAHLLLAEAFATADPLRARAHRDRAQSIG